MKECGGSAEPPIALLARLADTASIREGTMRKIFLVAAFAASLSASTAVAEDLMAQLSLSPADVKFNTPECVGMRDKARNYKDGLMDQSAGTYIIAAVAPGGTVGFLALQHRKRELFKAQVEQACMTNPPDRSYLDSATKD